MYPYYIISHFSYLSKVLLFVYVYEILWLLGLELNRYIFYVCMYMYIARIMENRLGNKIEKTLEEKREVHTICQLAIANNRETHL